MFQHMREVAQRRQQLEVEHEQARLSLQEKQEEVRRLQQVGMGCPGAGMMEGDRLLDASLVIHSSNEHLLITHCVLVAGAEWWAKTRPLTNQQVRSVPEMTSHRGVQCRGAQWGQ